MKKLVIIISLFIPIFCEAEIIHIPADYLTNKAESFKFDYEL